MWRTLHNQKDKEKENKRKTMDELIKCFTKKSAVKANMKDFKAAKASGAGDEAGTNSNIDVGDSDSDDEEFTKSQEDLLGEYVEAEEGIKEELQVLNKKMKTYTLAESTCA